MNNVVMYGMWTCHDCGATGPAEPLEDGDSFYSPHTCGGDEE